MCEGIDIRNYTKKINIFQNKKISSFEIIDYSYIVKNNFIPEFNENLTLITDCFLEKAFCKGKYICLKFIGSDKYLISYCGKWDMKESKYDKFSISIKNKKIYFSDQKSFGKIILREKKDFLDIWNSIGIDVLSKIFTKEKFKEIFNKKIKISKSCKNISSLLIDQNFISSLELSLVSDILYIANINPNTISKLLNKTQINCLYRSIKKIAIEKHIYKEKYEYKIYEKIKINENYVEVFQTKKRKIYWLPENHPY